MTDLRYGGPSLWRPLAMADRNRRSHILEADLYTEMNMDSSLIDHSMAVDSSLDRGGGRAATADGMLFSLLACNRKVGQWVWGR